MSKKFMFFALSLSILLVFSCVSKNKYVELENQANTTRERLEQENKSLSNQVAQLERELDKERTTVEVQKKKISELDQTRQEIENNLKSIYQDLYIIHLPTSLKLTFLPYIKIPTR